MIPLLTLGIPGDAITAIMMGVFLIHGIIPGPELFIKPTNIVYAIFIILIVSSLLHLVIAKTFLGLFVKLISVSKSILFPSVIIICFAGTFSGNSNVFDVHIMIIFGILGYLMKKTDFSIPTFLIEYILGPLLETLLVQTVIIFEGSLLSVFQRPIVILFSLLTVIFLVWTILSQRKNRREHNSGLGILFLKLLIFLSQSGVLRYSHRVV